MLTVDKARGAVTLLREAAAEPPRNMATAEAYRAHCEAALTMARAATDPATRQAIYQIARSWLDLAEEAALLDGYSLFDTGRLRPPAP